MLYLNRVRNVSLCLISLSTGTIVHAGEWEIGGSITLGQESKPSITNNGSAPTRPYTIVTNRFSGPWTQGGLHLGYEVVHRGSWGVWLQAHYAKGLVQPNLSHSGVNQLENTLTSEDFHGTASYQSLFFGVGLTRQVSLGEFGFSLGSRAHDLRAEGTTISRDPQSPLPIVAPYSIGHKAKDIFISMSFTAIQDQEGFKSFQKIAVGTGFGASIPAVNPGPSDWKMREAYLAQIRPNHEIRITLGVRI